jgi:DNA-binding transcriptional ArsR family regulator
VFVVREQKTWWTRLMLKPQDLMVTLKILSFECHGNSLIPTDEGEDKPWVLFEPISLYYKDQDEIIISDEMDDFDAIDLERIEKFLKDTEIGEDYSNWTYRKLAQQLFMSLSETSQAIKRATAAGLLIKRESKGIKVNKKVLTDYIRYGVGVSFFTEKGKIVRGIPTAIAAPSFKNTFASAAELPSVWPCARGTARGVAISPLYKSVSKAVMIDPWLYKQLALVDIFRVGSAREKEEALYFLGKLKG